MLVEDVRIQIQKRELTISQFLKSFVMGGGGGDGGSSLWGNTLGIVSTKRDLAHNNISSTLNRNVLNACVEISVWLIKNSEPEIQLHDRYFDSQCVRSNVRCIEDILDI